MAPENKVNLIKQANKVQIELVQANLSKWAL